MNSQPQFQVDNNGTQTWRLTGASHNVLHRDDGPARIWPDGGQDWYWRGRLHRCNGPAVVRAHESRWYKMMKLHRLDGPAIINTSGFQQWHLEGKNMTAQIETWMKSKGVSWPWNEEVQMDFLLTWS